MSATVVQLERPFRRNYDWSAKELAEFYRVEAALIQAGLRIDTERGVTDEGDPWFAFCKPGDGDVIVHIARIDGLYILAGPSYQGVATGRDIATLVRDLVNRYPLIQMGSDSRRQNSKIFVHPAALLIAVVATAFFKSAEARALGDTEKSPADDQRLTDGHRGGATIRPDPYPTFDTGKKGIVTDAAQTAIILSAVVAALQTPQPYQIERGLLASAGLTPDVSELGVLARQQTPPATTAFVAEEPAFQHASIASSLGPAAPAISSQTGLGYFAPAAVLPTALLSEALTLVVVLWDFSSKPAAAPIPAHNDAGSGLVSGGNAAPASALLSFKLASSPSTDSLPVVQSVKVAYSATQGTAETHSIARPDQLPGALLNALRDGAHTAIDGSSLDLSNSGGQGSSFASVLLASVTSHFPTQVVVPSVQQTDVHSAPLSQIAHDSTDHAIVTAVSSINYADIAALIQDFISHVPVWTRVSEGNQVVLYDVGALSEHGNALKSVTFDFQDGSTLSLVGLASALPQSLLHQRDGSELFPQASQSSSAQAQTVSASAEVQTAPTSAQVQGSADAAGNAAHSIEVPATSWTDHLPSGVAAALNDSARATVSAGATSPSSAGSLAMSLIVSLHDPSSGAPLQLLTSPDLCWG